MKTKHFYLSVVTLVVIAIVVFMAKRHPMHFQTKASAPVAIAPKNRPHSFEPTRDLSGKIVDPVTDVKLPEKADAYFQKAMKEKNFADLYKASVKFFGNKKGGKAASKFVALGLIFDSSAEYNQLMKSSIADMRANSKSLYQQINANQSQISQSPLFQESILNVVHQLDLSTEQKANFYGQVVEQKLQLTSGGSLTQSSLTVVTALLFMKQNQVSYDQLKPFVVSALQNYQQGEPARAAFQARITKIYPESSQLF